MGWACVLLAFALTSAVGCKPEPLPGESNSNRTQALIAEVADEGPSGFDPVLLSIGGRALTLGEFEARAARMSEIAQFKLNTTQSRSDLLEIFVWVEILALAAGDQGLIGGAEEVLFATEVQARANIEAHAARTINPDELEDLYPAWYDAHRDTFVRPERRRIYGIVVDSAELAERVHAEVAQALAFVELGHAFGRLAPYYSIDPVSAADGGRMGTVQRIADGGTGDPALIDAVFAVEETGLGPIVRTSRGWEIFAVVLVTPALDLPLDEVRTYVAERVSREADAADMRATLDSAREAIAVEIDADAIAELAALRDAALERPIRPRRFSSEALAADWNAELGVDVAAQVTQDSRDIVDNPLTRPRVPPLMAPGEPGVAPEGSGEPATNTP